MKPFAHHPDELISASLTGELTELERRELDAHLVACPECRDTLDAFRQQRQLLGAMSEIPVPRDLGARVRTGIESGRFALPWYRRPVGMLAGAASLATVAVAALLAVVLLNRPSVPQIGAHSASPEPSAVASLAPPSSASPAASSSPQAVPLDAKAGDLIYPAIRGTVPESAFTIENDSNGKSVTASAPPGQLISAALSPNGQWLAFVAERGLSGANGAYAVHLTDGTTTSLGDTDARVTFTDRLAWSPDGRYIAYTLAPFDLSTGRSADPAGAGATEAFLFDTTTGSTSQLTDTGNAYAASWAPLRDGDETLWISFGQAASRSVAYRFPAGDGLSALTQATTAATADGVFLPLISPDGDRALFWQGTMQRADNGWTFLSAGLPHLTQAQVAGIPSFTSGTPAFVDLTLTSASDGFQTGDLTWSADSDTFAFWNGHWSGVQQPAGYPDDRGIYIGRASDGLLSQTSALRLGLTQAQRVVSVAINPDGSGAAVTIGYPTPGDLAGPSASLWLVDLRSGAKKDIASGGSNPPWYGPATFLVPSPSP